MNLFADKETCDVMIIENDNEYLKFLKSSSAHIAFVPEPYPECKGPVMKSAAGDFAKWLNHDKPELNIDLRKSDGKLVLRDSVFHLPLAYLANDITIQFYLNLVSNYIYDRMKGALRGEKARVDLTVIYQDNKDGINKKFCFKGDSDTLVKIIKQIDLNKFMEK